MSNKLVKIGYWLQDEVAGCDLNMFIDDSWSNKERNTIIKYLDSGQEYLNNWDDWHYFPRSHWFSSSTRSSLCHICNCSIFHHAHYLHDGIYIWPKNLSHYLRHHEVRLPDLFLNYVLNKEKPKRIFEETLFSKSINGEWWEKQKGFLRNSSDYNPKIENSLKKFIQWADINEISKISIPRDMETLRNRTYLNIADNQLTALPESIGGLVKLTSLNVEDNYLGAFRKSRSIIFLLTEA